MPDDRENVTAYLAGERRTFAQRPLRDADLLACAALCYMELERYPQIARDEPTIGRLAEYGPLPSFVEHDCNPDGMLPLLSALVSSPRFRDVPIRGFRCVLDEGRGMQFGALCLPVAPDQLVVVFRGTDMSYAGWQEDFDMMCNGPVPGQEEALRYLRQAAALYPGRRLVVCGHSKGGSCAEYATVFADAALQRRIERAVSFDGPALYRLAGPACPELRDYDAIVRERYRGLRVPLVRYIFPAMIGLSFEPSEESALGHPFVESVDPVLSHNVCSARVQGGELVRTVPSRGQVRDGLRFSRWVRHLGYAGRVTVPGFLVAAFRDAGIPIDLAGSKSDAAAALRRRYRREPPASRRVLRCALAEYLRAGL